MMRPAPSFLVMKSAMAAIDPESSMSLPKRAPSKKSGKNWAKNPAALRMKVCVQCARMGSCANRAAVTAAMGASRRTLHPLKASQIRTPRPTSIPRRPMRSEPLIVSDLRQQNVEVGRRPLSEVLSVLSEKGLGAAPALLLQHHEKRALGVELRRRAEFGKPVG